MRHNERSDRRKKSRKEGWLITRVSTTNQGLVQHGSLEQQEKANLRSLQWHGEETQVEYVVTRVISEERSGRRNKYHLRIGLEETLYAIRAGEIDFVSFDSVHRMGRWARKNLEVIEVANDYQVEVFIAGKKYDHRSKADRIRFGIDSILAEEESNENSERVTRKQREAMVNNGKDSQTAPVLGLDAHPVKVACYEPNKTELPNVIDIMEKFCELKSYLATSQYCERQGYRTKVRYTKEKTDKDGNRIPPRKIGGETCTPQRLRELLTNSKYRGYSTFEDTFDQFPKDQDEDGYVKWEYWHRREYGDIIPPDLLAKVDAVVEEIAKGTRAKSCKDGSHSLLSGPLKGADGVRFHHEPAGGKRYYKHRTLGIRIPAEKVEKAVLARVKQYLTESGTLHNVIKSALKHRLIGVPMLADDITKWSREVKKLETMVEGFSNSLRDAALKNPDQVATVCAMLAAEKSKAENELGEARAALTESERRKTTIEKRFQNSTAEEWLRRVMERFDQKSDIEKNRIVQTIIPEMILRPDNKLELRVNPDPAGSVSPPPSDRHGMSEEKWFLSLDGG